MQRLANVAGEVRCGVSSRRQMDVGRVERRPLTDEEQSLLNLRRVCLPTGEAVLRNVPAIFS